jgi:2-amino-4-hydroxy-6-hydroxymethyldihydropteridine diphosphokinase
MMARSVWRTAAIAIGSNLGDRASHLAFARRRLGEILGNLRFSTVFETEPYGVRAPQAMFLNAAAVGETNASARGLLTALLAIERERGRERPFDRAPRTLDLDLILLGDAILNEPDLIVPHPRFRERRFVLEPLAEVGSGLIDPVSGETVGRLLHALGGG